MEFISLKTAHPEIDEEVLMYYCRTNKDGKKIHFREIGFLYSINHRVKGIEFEFKDMSYNDVYPTHWAKLPDYPTK